MKTYLFQVTGEVQVNAEDESQARVMVQDQVDFLLRHSSKDVQLLEVDENVHS